MSSIEVLDKDRAGRIESHGTDYVNDTERRGKPRELFGVWAGSNVAYLYFVLGSLLIIFGLNVWEAIAVVLAGNLLWVGVGYLATSGPAAGSPSEVIARAFFGVNGNRIVAFISGWMVGVLYEAINLSVGALAGFAFVQQFVGTAPAFVKISIVVALAIATFTISVFGHGTIIKLGPWFTWILLTALIVLAWFVITHANFGYVPKGGGLSGGALWATAAAGFAIIASAPLSWPVGADYSRYLPRTTSAKSVAFWTAFGGFIPATGIAILGVLAATVVDMSNPETAIAGLVPSWFYVIFLLVIILGSVFNNALTAYSTGLALLAAGIPWRRSRTVIFDAVVAVGVTLYALFISNFLDTLSGLLEVSITVLAPYMAIYAVDIYLRRNRYDGPGLQDMTRKSAHWHTGGFNLAGFIALLVGAVGSLMFVNTTFWVGPLASALGGADLSVFVGGILGGGIYAAATARKLRAHSDAALHATVRPQPAGDGQVTL
ncbi:purine-cytosine permease family protein [Leifsonia shinshuensis]|uniref:Nitrate reductase n=1 Tax=Leifsonia shinshuensis TaxID=150026 RepID=A0A7G6YA33_9MICO|nr:cytosine permease [Leifsonia shinshuensis]QNE35348.1 nitrate reductase [Leifsonia shinshuensis]